MAGDEEKGGAEEQTPMEATQSRFDEYRERIAAGESVFTEEAAAELASAADAKPAAEAEEEAPAEEEEAGAEEGGEEEAAAADDGAADEGGEEEEEAEAEGEEEESGDEGADGITVELPGRNEGETVAFVVDDQDSADALLRLNKGYIRGEQMAAKEAKVAEAWAEIDEIDEGLQADPVGFIKEHVSKEHRATLALDLLLDDEVFSSVSERLDEIEDPEKREVMRLRVDKERRELTDKSKAKLQQRKAARAAVTKIGEQVRSLVPDEMETDRAVRFQVAAMNVAEDLVGKLKRFELTESEVIEALSKEGLLDRFGIDPVAAPAKKAAGSKRSAGEPPKKKSAGKKPAARTAEGLKKASLRRKSVAGSASSGAGAPAATVQLERSSSVKDRIKEVRKKGLGNVLAGK